MTQITVPAAGSGAEHHRLPGAFVVFGALVLFAGVLFGLTAGVGLVWTATTGGSHPAAAGPASAAAAPAAAVQNISMTINPPPDFGVKNASGDTVDAFVPASFTVKAGVPVRVTVTTYDDMPHTFTAPDLGVDQMIAGGSNDKPNTVTFTFTPTHTGSFEWLCKTPCDTWAMANVGFMRGIVTVTA